MAHRRYFHIRREKIKGEKGYLEAEEARHISSVCRLKEGDSIDLLDGEGGIYRAELINSSPSGAEVTLIGIRRLSRDKSFDMAISLIKGGRMDSAVEKCSEIGAGRIIPFTSSRSVWRGGRKEAEGKRERLQRKVIAACKQSGNPFFPEIEPVMEFEQLLEAVSGYDSVYVADPSGERLSGAGAARVLGVVGPEGGLSEAEIEALLSRGAVKVSLGENRLRTETAAACMLFYIMVISNR